MAPMQTQSKIVQPKLRHEAKRGGGEAGLRNQFQKSSNASRETMYPSDSGEKTRKGCLLRSRSALQSEKTLSNSRGEGAAEGKAQSSKTFSVSLSFISDASKKKESNAEGGRPYDRTN